MNLRGAVKHAVKHGQAERLQRMATPPGMRVVSRQGPAKICYLCPDTDRPVGGVRAIYRHVDILNAAGLPATVVHTRDGFACTWFGHRTRVAAAGSITLSHQDILVVPEWYGPGLGALPSGVPIVIFNQNAYKTFSENFRTFHDVHQTKAPYQDISELAAVLVVSQDNAEYLRFAAPELRVVLVRNAINPALFHPAPRPAPRRIALMPRRRASDARQVLRLLAAHGSLKGWDVVMIDGHSETETANLLRSCAVFLSFSAQEGFGLPPAEAMACGCYVVGFHGLAGREYFRPQYSSPVEDGDLLAFAKAAAGVLAQDPAALAAKARLGSAYIRRHYSPEGQRDDLLAFFAPLLDARA
jgi:hypothetical protein